MKKEYVKPCPNCKLFSMYLADAHFSGMAISLRNMCVMSVDMKR